MKIPRHLLLYFALLLATVSVQAQDNFTWDNATVYFVLTDRFENGNPSNDNSYGRNTDPVGGFLGGDLQGLTNKINEGYFDDLGVTAIWLTAPYEQIHGPVPGYWNCYPCDEHYAYHGYYALDFTEVDANMGTVTDMQNFVDAAHNHGIRVVMDIVLNHFGYASTWDAAEFGFGPVSDPNNPAWCNWLSDEFGTQWVRAGETGTDYCAASCSGDDLGLCLGGLPDVRTELTTDVGLPNILRTKWDNNKENQELAELNAFFSENNLPKSPANHIVKWLTDWVRDYGIDGFRIDTYKHVERSVWGELKLRSQDAFDDWKAANPSKVLDDKDFWMVGEWYGHGPDKNVEAATTGRTDALINFNFQGQAGNPANLENTYAGYAAIANDPEWNFLSYISSHDTDLFDRNDLVDAGTSLLLAPGAVQIYYGDETQRPFGTSGSDQDTRSYMNWGSINTTVQSHWQKLGQFRKAHPAIGAGTHTKMADNPYTFKREYSSETICDIVVMAIGASGSTTLDVSSAFPDGTEVRDYYTGNMATVTGGSVTFSAGNEGIILIEQMGAGDCPPKVFFTTQAPNAPDDTYDANSLTVAINAALPGGADLTIYYTTDGTTPTTSSNVYTNPLTFGNPSDVTLKAMACENGTANCSGVIENRYLVGNLPTFKVYFQKPSIWGEGAPNIYHWEAQPVGNLESQMWPGTAMTLECDDWYSYTFENILSTNVIFNNGTSQGTNQTNDLVANQDSYYDDPTLATGTYSLKNGIPNTGCTLPVACFSTNTTNGGAPLAVTFNADCSRTPSGTTLDSYSWDFGDGNVETGVNTAHTYTEAGTFTATLTVTNSEGETDTETTTITVVNIPPPASGIKVYFEKPEGWGSDIRIYYWDATPVASVASTMWPGDEMADEGGGWYSYTFPDEVAQINIVFNAGGTTKTADLTIDQNAWFPITCVEEGTGIGSNGNWVFSDPMTTSPQTFDVFFENTDNWVQPKIYYWEADGMPGTVWPGEDMTPVSGNVWKFTFDNTSKACLIFNNDDAPQTANINTTAPGGTFNYASGQWTPANAPIDLPVELTSFEANSKNCNIYLSWTINTENRLSHYEIQRSENGLRFQTIGEVTALNKAMATYEFIDENSNSAAYYRLKSVEKDGGSSFSDISYIQSTCVQDFYISPNPFNQQTQIQFDLPIDMEVAINVFNISGQETDLGVKKWLTEGRHFLKFDTSMIPEGVYVYRLTAGNSVLTKKLVKVEK